MENKISFAYLTVSLLVVFQGFLWADNNELFLADPELNLYETTERTCAVSSVYLVLKELGAEASLSDIAGQIKITEKGSSAADICDFLKSRKIDCLAVGTADFNSVLKVLSPNKHAAIFHMDDGSHFVTVKKQPDGELVVFDGTDVIKGNVMETLENRYSDLAVIAGDNIKVRFYTGFIIRKLPYFLAVILLGFALGMITKRFTRKSADINQERL